MGTINNIIEKLKENCMNIDVTMTATLRPELLQTTLVTFQKYLFNESMQSARLIINIDPVGHNISSNDIIVLCEDFFGEVISNVPQKAHFPTAFKWCWSQVQRPFVFHLEEDWELLTSIDLSKMLSIMTETKDLMVLRLPFSPCYDTNKSWGHFLTWNGSFYEVPEDKKGLLGFCGHPSLIRKDFVDKALQMIDGVGNPEKQLKWRPGHELMQYKYGVYGYHGMPAAVKDIGRDWRVKHGFGKVDNTGKDNNAFFTRWSKNGK